MLRSRSRTRSRERLATRSRRFALAFALAGSMLAVAGCEDARQSPVPVDFGISDAAVGDVDAVVVTIDRVTIDQPGPDIVVETFPAEIPGDPDVDTLTIDLLDYQGEARKLIIDDLLLMPGPYQNIRLSIIDDDTSLTHVHESNGDVVPLKVPSNELKLGGFYVDVFWPQTFVLEFDLSRAMTYNPGPDRYILKPRGVRVVDVEEAASISGTVDPALFDAGDCASKPDPSVGNVVYLYAGHGLDLARLGDVFDPQTDPVAASQWIEPYASERVASDGSYLVAYLPAGPYTVAFACDAANDDPDVDDGIVIPDPAGQWAEVSLPPGHVGVCDFVAGTMPGACPTSPAGP
jgi:hypothetical protein